MTYVLAPLAEFTDAPFRRLCHEGGAARTYTEMVSAAALAHGSSPTRHLFEKMPGEGCVACQLFGATERDLALATRLATETRNFVEINLNAGCPMTKITRAGAGAKLAEDPSKVFRLIKSMVENTPLPVTLKTRLGPHPQCTTVFELLDAAQQAGAKAMVVHARYTSQMHGGSLHLGVLADVVARAAIPIIGNGSVVDARSAAAMAATGVKEIMIGRAALAHPDIFATLNGVPSPLPTSAAERCQRHLDYILAFREQLAERYPNDHVPSPDGFASVKMHTHLFRYFNGRPGAAALRARLNTVRSLAEIRAIIAAQRVEEEKGA